MIKRFNKKLCIDLSRIMILDMTRTGITTFTLSVDRMPEVEISEREAKEVQDILQEIGNQQGNYVQLPMNGNDRFLWVDSDMVTNIVRKDAGYVIGLLGGMTCEGSSHGKVVYEAISDAMVDVPLQEDASPGYEDSESEYIPPQPVKSSPTYAVSEGGVLTPKFKTRARRRKPKPSKGNEAEADIIPLSSPTKPSA